MTTSSFKMIRHLIACVFSVTIISSMMLSSCKRDNDFPENSPASSYSSEVIEKWLTLQVRLMKNATGPNHGFSRHFSYSGITAVESLAPGFPGHYNKFRKWNGLTGLPAIDRNVNYYYPANVNAALAAINRSFFPLANETDKKAIDSLEKALNDMFLTVQPASRIDASAAYGKAVAAAVYNWSETDGYKVANAPYTWPTGPGLWVPTPPTFAAPATPYWGNNNTVVKNSINNTQPGPLPAYSTDPSSEFHKMAKYIFDVSQTLTQEQKDIAVYWIDAPGVTAPGHWVSILKQVLQKTSTRLDKAALAYALTGSAINDAVISGWKTKYKYNVVRPITYIRDIMGKEGWNSHVTTPAHPEYSSGHSLVAGSAAHIMQAFFGNIGSFTDHTYDYRGYAPRTYSSFEAIALEAAWSRVYGGIHYKPSIEAGLLQGKKVAENILK